MGHNRAYINSPNHIWMTNFQQRQSSGKKSFQHMDGIIGYSYV